MRANASRCGNIWHVFIIDENEDMSSQLPICMLSRAMVSMRGWLTFMLEYRPNLHRQVGRYFMRSAKVPTGTGSALFSLSGFRSAFGIP